MRNLFDILLGIIIALLLLTHWNQRRSKIRDENMIEVMKDSVKHWKDEYGNEHAKSKVIESNNLDLFTKLESTNETIKELQKVIKSNKKVQSATVVKTVTKIDTVLVRVKDTFKIKDKDIDYIATLKNDSLTTQLSLTSYLKLVHRYERKNIFSKKYLIIDAYEDNKYIKVDDVRSLRLPVEHKRFGIGPFLGYDIINGNFSGGISVNYNVLLF